MLSLKNYILGDCFLNQKPPILSPRVHSGTQKLPKHFNLGNHDQWKAF
jgi:hypothetical protein